MLQVQKLNIYHTYNHHQLVENAHFTINPGDKTALVGAEGTGKSSLLQWLYNPDNLADYVTIEGNLVNQFTRMAYLPQIVSPQTLSLSLEDFLYKEDDLSEIDFNLFFQYCAALAFDYNSLELSRPLASLSGGQRIKLQLIKLLSKDPDLLLLDEPSNDLDLATVDWLVRFIQESPKTILYVSHDEYLLKETAQKIIHLEQLVHKSQPRFTEANYTYQEYIDRRQNKFQHQMQVARKQQEDQTAKVRRQKEIEHKLHQELNQTKDSSAGRLLAKKMKNIQSQGRRFEREAESYEEVPMRDEIIQIEFNRVKALANKQLLHLYQEPLKAYGQTLVNRINLTLDSHDKIGIIGANGIGKTSFLKYLQEHLSLRSDIQIGYMPQNYGEVLDYQKTAIAFLTKTADQEERTLIMTALGSADFTPEEMEQPVENLSGGQQAKLLLLKYSLDGSNVLLLDEPTRNFSPLSQAELRGVFQSFPGAFVAVSHNREFLQDVCHKVYELTAVGLELVEWD